MAGYIIRRLILLLPILFGVSLAVFLVMHLFTVDPAEIILGQHATPEQVAVVREELGLNKPVYVQFWDYISRTAHGDLGQSLLDASPRF